MTTRKALVAASRRLFAHRGFAAAGTEEIVTAAGVSRGALYHHFPDKGELFAAVFEAVEIEIIGRIAGAVADAQTPDPIAAMRVGAAAWLDICTDPEVHRVALLDAPAVLGWERWRDIAGRHSVKLVLELVGQAIASEAIAQQPVAPLTHIILGAVRESALYVATASHPGQARREVGAALDRLIQALAAPREPSQAVS